MQIMAATVNYLSKHVHRHDTERIFTELRHSLADITPMSAQRLPWSEVRIDRSNRRWESLCALAKLLIRRDWQATHHTNAAPQGLTLLFPMNDLFARKSDVSGKSVSVAVEPGGRSIIKK